MSTETNTIEELANREYKWGFVTDIEADTAPRGLNEEIVRFISAKKNEPNWLLEWRLKAYRHWLTMKEPRWPNVRYSAIDYQDMIYYSAPKQKKQLKSLDEVDPELRRTYEKLGISLQEQERLSGVAVDAVFDSVSVATTFKEKLRELGIIFCSFSDAVKEHPDLVKKHLGSVVPANDNFFAALNSAVFSDGSFCYIPKGIRCPMELSTYFRINAAETGQFEHVPILPCQRHADESQHDKQRDEGGPGRADQSRHFTIRRNKPLSPRRRNEHKDKPLFFVCLVSLWFKSLFSQKPSLKGARAQGHPMPAR